MTTNVTSGLRKRVWKGICVAIPRNFQNLFFKLCILVQSWPFCPKLLSCILAPNPLSNSHYQFLSMQGTNGLKVISLIEKLSNNCSARLGDCTPNRAAMDPMATSFNQQLVVSILFEQDTNNSLYFGWRLNETVKCNFKHQKDVKS